jgi:hypothetical protein
MATKLARQIQAPRRSLEHVEIFKIGWAAAWISARFHWLVSRERDYPQIMLRSYSALSAMASANNEEQAFETVVFQCG